MTYDEAIIVRSVDLSGGYVRPVYKAEAVWILREGEKGRRPFSAARFAIDNEQVRLLELELAK